MFCNKFSKYLLQTNYSCNKKGEYLLPIKEAVTEALCIHDVSSLLKAEQEATKEEIREWLIAEDFEGLAEPL